MPIPISRKRYNVSDVLWFRKTILEIANELIKVNKILKKVDTTTSKIVLKYILEKSIVSIAR